MENHVKKEGQKKSVQVDKMLDNNNKVKNDDKKMLDDDNKM